jgi:hypothetical protein
MCVNVPDDYMFMYLLHYATSREVAGSSPDEVNFLQLT